MPVLSQTTIEESLEKVSRSSINQINKLSFLAKKLSCGEITNLFKLMNVGVVSVAGIDIEEADCNCLKQTLAFSQDCDDSCSGINLYNYISNFNLSEGSVLSIVEGATPNDFVVTLRGIEIDYESSSDYITYSDQYTGLTLTISNGDEELYRLENIESSQIPEDIVFTINDVVEEESVELTFFITGVNQDGLICVSRSLMSIDPDGKITVFCLNTFTFSNSDETQPTFSVPGSTLQSVTIFNNSGSSTSSTNNLSLLYPQLAFGINQNTGIFNAGSFFANCAEQRFSYIQVDFDCELDEMEIVIAFSFGLEFDDEFYIEASTDNTNWNLVEQFIPNFTVFNLNLEWNHDLFPYGQTVYLRLRSRDVGVIFTDTVEVADCDCQLKFVSETYPEYNCNESTGELILRSCWSWSELLESNEIVAEFQTSPTSEPTVWTELVNLGNLPVSQAPSVCYDFDVSSAKNANIYIRFRDTANGCISDLFEFSIPNCIQDTINLGFGASINNNVEFELNGNADIDWGDGSAIENVVGGAIVTHAYPAPTDYTAVVYGNISEIKNFTNNNLKSFSVLQGTHSNLTYVDITSDAIQSVNLPGITAIQTLNVYTTGGLLPNIDLTGLSTIQHLRITGVPFISYTDFSETPNLSTLWLNSCSLVNLDVSGLVLLFQLEAMDNSLSSIDINSNPIIDNVRFTDNILTTISCSLATTLTSLNIEYNQFSIEPIVPPNITSLNCQANQLTLLDLSAYPNLTTLICGSNVGLTSIDLSQCPNLTILSCSGNAMLTIDISPLTQLQVLQVANCQLSSIDITQSLQDYVTVTISSNLLTSMQVDAALSFLASQTGVNGIFQSQLQTPPAPPSGAGIGDILTLQGRGWTVTTD